ncbi:adenylyl cyclase [Knoellia sp. LjRoot47]|uniref:adenylyl cyclase n=1 Tax=Knoellia sp. LjRoot47 TaxID=3342330 RepID=UPI003ED066E2
MFGALSPASRPALRSRPLALLAAAGLGLCTALLGGPAAASAPRVSAPGVSAPALPAPALAQAPPGGATTLGPRVVVFDPSMPVAQIQARADAIHAQQVDDEMGSARWSLLFRPGTYGTATQPLQIKVGYYTEVAGLGASPSDTVINGKVEVYNRCLADAPSQPYCVALNNFWRSMSNLTIQVNGTGQDGCRASANFWAVSQASSLRRVDIRGGNLSLMDYCTAGPQFASGGFLADSRAGAVINGSQQQWITRNSEIGSWSNGVWNQVFAGTVGAPPEQGFPNPPYTTLDRTSVSREKPFLFVDGRGAWQVRVPDARTSSRGTDWTTGSAAGRTLPLSAFHVATPADAATELASQLSRGKHLLLTPGIYDVDKSLVIRRDDTVVLGMGQATLTAVRGAVPLVVDKQAHGVVVAGVTIDAGTTLSPTLMQVGRPGPAGKNATGARVPRSARAGIPSTTLNDVYFRVGGPHVGKADVSLRIDADDVLIDHAWVWRADHGVEGFTAGASGDTDRWRTNIGRVGLVVNGDRVHATGLFVEHYQQHNTIWNGEDGEVVLYQNELPYDPPSQAEWNRPDGTRGWTGYTVADAVQRHRLYGGGVYVYNRNDPSIVTERGFEVPERPGVRLHHVLTVNLDAGAIEHVVNDTGARVDSTRSGQPSYVVDYPAP